MALWKLTLAYDGTPYFGWQVQPLLPTVQGTLADAIYGVTRERVLPQGSGRTDTGVHAVAQVASFELASSIPPENFRRALNRKLPTSLRVLLAEHACEGFHARHSARGKTYEYRVFPLHAPTPRPGEPADETAGLRERVCPPWLAPFCWPCPLQLDVALLNRAAKEVLGEHDFTTFAASDSRGANPCHTPIRTIWSSEWTVEGDLLLYRIRGSGFLHHMVRNLVGTFAEAGRGRIPPEGIAAMLEARCRSAGGPTAPASGLFLVSVDYADSINETADGCAAAEERLV